MYGRGDGHGNVCGFGLMHGETLVGYTASDAAYALIVDIGTTTVAALLLRGRDPKAVQLGMLLGGAAAIGLIFGNPFMLKEFGLKAEANQADELDRKSVV